MMKIVLDKLSTPHGALGTKLQGETENLPLRQRSFNSTRCIRNAENAAIAFSERQLSTPHGALGTSPEGRVNCRVGSFQLHTVHQERDSISFNFLPGFAFNSTRCIRNPHNAIYCVPYFLVFQLHTVHQEQGVPFSSFVLDFAFNSTRCIRNLAWIPVRGKKTKLSTPHGALGTPFLTKHRFIVGRNYFQLHTVHQELYGENKSIDCYISFNSTRCIRNKVRVLLQHCRLPPFNSTRCIRN